MATIAFPKPMIEATFLRRYKRFLADFRLVDGTEVVAHCANTGSMKGSLAPGAPALIWDSNNPERKTRYSWKAILMGKTWVGIDTQVPNRLVAAAIASGEIKELSGYSEITSEPKLSAGSRADLLLSGKKGQCWVEVKNVTLVEKGVARFPDAVTTRGRKHLGELADKIAKGDRAAIVFLVQRADGKRFIPADDIDPDFGAELRRVADLGVIVFALGARVDKKGVHTRGLLPVTL